MMRDRKSSRRGLLAGFVGLVGGYGLSANAAGYKGTPRAAEGPFYPKPSMRMADVDNDLVKIKGVVEQAGGEVITLRGVLFNQQGKPLVGHRIEIWQCDVNGKYLHTGDGRRVEYDQAFQGFGFDITDEMGGYVFRTIKPTVYPGRAPHIHVKVLEADRELLTTQFYIKGDVNNTRDGLFNRMSDAQAESVSMSFMESESGLEATINIVV